MYRNMNNMSKHQTFNGSEIIEQEKNVVVVSQSPILKIKIIHDVSVLTAEVAATPNIVYTILKRDRRHWFEQTTLIFVIGCM